MMTKKLKQIRKRKIRIEIEYLLRLVKSVRPPIMDMYLVCNQGGYWVEWYGRP